MEGRYELSSIELEVSRSLLNQIQGLETSEPQLDVISELDVLGLLVLNIQPIGVQNGPKGADYLERVLVEIDEHLFQHVLAVELTDP